MNVNQIRRNVRNVVHNYSDAQVKVREATSNDPWGPSSTLMSQIAEYSHNMIAFTDIMQMVWRRLNDHGKNWRHVYKALVLLEYLIKVGSERVAQQCRENIFSIETLKDFQYMEDNTDHGRSVRERSKQLVLLLKDEEQLKNERVRAIKAHERFLESGTGTSHQEMSSISPGDEERSVDGQLSRSAGGAARSSVASTVVADSVEAARPQTAGEEQLQLQLALAMSQEQAEKDRQREHNDQLRLQMALQQSSTTTQQKQQQKPQQAGAGVSALDDLLGLDEQLQRVNTHLTSNMTSHSSRVTDPWTVVTSSSGASSKNDPWCVKSDDTVDSSGTTTTTLTNNKNNDPWTSSNPAGHVTEVNDPWSVQLAGSDAAVTTTSITDTTASITDTVHHSSLDVDEFSQLTKRQLNSANTNNGSSANNNPWKMSEISHALTPTPLPSVPPVVGESQRGGGTRSPHDFLGENVTLVNLDNLVGGPLGGASSHSRHSSHTPNPFGWSAENNINNSVSSVQSSTFSSSSSSCERSGTVANPFLAQQNTVPSINQMRDKKFEENVNSSPWNAVSPMNPFSP